MSLTMTQRIGRLPYHVPRNRTRNWFNVCCELAGIILLILAAGFVKLNLSFPFMIPYIMALAGILLLASQKGSGTLVRVR